MPAPPEILDAARKIRAAEVAHQPEAQDARAAERDVGIAREIAVHLKCEQERGDDVSHRRAHTEVAVDLVHVDGGGVGHDHLLEQPPRDLVAAVGKGRRVGAVLLAELRQQRDGALDGPGHELREKADIQRVDAEVALGLHLPAVHIDGVAQRLERVEADAHRQDDVQRKIAHRERHRAQQRRDALTEEIEILEEEQAREAQAHAAREPRAARLFRARALHPQRSRVARRGGEQNEKHEVGVPAHVEVIARAEQEHPPHAVRHKEVRRRDEREKDGILPGIEQHRANSLSVECVRPAARPASRGRGVRRDARARTCASARTPRCTWERRTACRRCPTGCRRA